MRNTFYINLLHLIIYLLLISLLFFQESDEGTERDTLEFELKVKCTKKTSNQNDSIRFEDLYNNHNGMYWSHC